MNYQQYIRRAKLNPASAFRRPMDVVEASNIAVAEKIAILKAWEVDEYALQRAESEGMGGGEHAHLQMVREALARLEPAVHESKAAADANRSRTRAVLHQAS